MYGAAMHAVASSNGIQSSKIDEYEADLKAAGDSTSGARKSLI
jgi:hypothetical protein